MNDKGQQVELELTGADFDLSVPVYVEADAELDQAGDINVVLYMFVGDSDEACSENRVSLTQIFNRWVDHYLTTEVGYNHLYSLSDSLREISNNMQNAANSIKELTVPVDHYEDDPDEYMEWERIKPVRD